MVLTLARRLRPAFQSSGLTAAKLSVVGQLRRAGPLTPSELAAREGVRVASLTRLLGELLRDGWLTRAPDATDGRRAILSLTPAGRRRLQEAAQTADAALAAAVAAAVPAADMALLRQACGLLERLDDALGEVAERAPRPATPTIERRPA